VTLLVASFSLFLSFLFIHILLWRIRRPIKDAGALFIIFIGIPTSLAILYILFSIFGSIPAPWFSLMELFSIWIMVVALGCAYIQFYPAAQAVSPSLEMILLVAQNRPNATSHSKIQELFTQQKLVMNRVQDLLNSGLAIRKEDKLVLTPSGRNLTRFFLFYRRLLGLDYNGG